MKFTNYYSNGAVCTPTRAALMTGNYQQRAGLEGVIYAAEEKRGEGGLPGEKNTIAEIFKANGYATGIFGKWHLGYNPEYNPIYHGFDEFYGFDKEEAYKEMVEIMDENIGKVFNKLKELGLDDNTFLSFCCRNKTG